MAHVSCGRGLHTLGECLLQLFVRSPLLMTSSLVFSCNSVSAQSICCLSYPQLLVRSTLSPAHDFFFAHGGMLLDTRPGAAMLLGKAASLTQNKSSANLDGQRLALPACAVALPLRDRLRLEGPNLGEEEVGCCVCVCLACGHAKLNYDLPAYSLFFCLCACYSGQQSGRVPAALIVPGP